MSEDKKEFKHKLDALIAYSESIGLFKLGRISQLFDLEYKEMRIRQFCDDTDATRLILVCRLEANNNYPQLLDKVGDMLASGMEVESVLEALRNGTA